MQSKGLAGTAVIVREDGTRFLGSDESSGWVWQAGRVLASQLLSTSNFDVRDLKILELGSGTGWLALTLAHEGAIVTATERPGALTLLTRNVYGHLERIAAKSDEAISVEVEQCKWEDNVRVAGEFDIIVGSDLLYIVESYPLLLNTLLLHNCKRCILTWEERIPLEETSFLALATAAGFKFDSSIHVGTNEATNNRVLYLDMSFGN
mmetsp:Transcript_15557/g.45009  ORF Transcript_15557/g.45009 Transcript_15557/m.45009 type:complete len:207 (-) Transcript_15557:140-760(-)|eukprot:CAMPEP_0181031112 /NCGR_PEP_ID=MMETSP1070-20121207/6066_1 /TAXON_ID=265543 /ORGANISM="Minutocellus polymorphus, Strain NH13" /LENGTH=206 /DNA_ID=CAMNT_0023108483 /DNA_START=359 /DNA_END=979 /DNA_ORIENTATION=-